jgi:hypothetical protein
MGINNQNDINDIIVLKTIHHQTSEELVNEVYWLCKEHNTQIVLTDNVGYGLGFIDTFKQNIDPYYISIREVNGTKIYNFDVTNKIKEDLNYGRLRFLQIPELAEKYYQKQFLGYSSIMQYHKETDKLVDEIVNVNLQVKLGNVVFGKYDDDIGKSRVSCLLMFYSHPLDATENKDENTISQYELSKRMSLYNIIYGTFYKYMFKCIENDNIQVLFYYRIKDKMKQFENITQEKEFRELFLDYIQTIKITKEDFEIRLHNGSRIKFVSGSDNSRGYRYHYAIVDKEINREIFDNVIRAKGVLFDMAEKEERLKDNYNIEFIDM